MLGEGKYSKVYLGYMKNNVNEKLAIKEIELTPEKLNNHKFIKNLNREISILKKLKHKNIV